jgi:hypothetical protein
VTKGWRGPREVNRVDFDPEQVSVKQMVDWLKKTGTYLRTIEESPEGDKSRKAIQ